MRVILSEAKNLTKILRCYAAQDLTRNTIYEVVNCLLVRLAGDSSGGATPVPIPNTVVKSSSADGTCGAIRRESRPLPASILNKAVWATSLSGVSFF